MRSLNLLTLLVLAGALTDTIAAHEIPGDVRLTVFVKPEGEQVEVLVRAPLVALRDVDFPLKGPGYLELAAAAPALETAARVWLADGLTLFADGEALDGPRLDAVRVALPSDDSFDGFAAAKAAVYGEHLSVSVNLHWEQALLDVALIYTNPAGADASLSVAPRFARLGLTTRTRVTYLAPDGGQRVLVLAGDPGRISLDPGPVETFGAFLAGGVEHVLDGTDHLLFVLALVVPLTLLRPLVVVVTAFTLAHSLTLGTLALGLVPAASWFPALVEVLIAATIFYLALENILRPQLTRRWLEAFGFGLVHGFGFSFALSDALPVAGDHLAMSLTGFNLGIELGQVLVLVVSVPALKLLVRAVPGRALPIVISALIAHTAWHWLVERWAVLAAYEVALPSLNAAFALGAVRWMMLLLAAALLVWLVHRPFERWAGVAEP